MIALLGVGGEGAGTGEHVTAADLLVANKHKRAGRYGY
jgi:hypothetical protein